jgi:hypothetical protein
MEKKKHPPLEEASQPLNDRFEIDSNPAYTRVASINPTREVYHLIGEDNWTETETAVKRNPRCSERVYSWVQHSTVLEAERTLIPISASDSVIQ